MAVILKKKLNARKKALIALISFASFIALIFIVFVVWAQFYYKASDDALANLNSTETVSVNMVENKIIFQPVSAENLQDTGLIFYPGGKVDEKAYSYLGKYIAEEGFFVCIVRMPLRLAVLNPGAAEDVINEYPEIKNWVIAGHSLGGSMASNYAFNNQDIIKGLAFLASYPAGSDDLNSSIIEVVSIAGTKDGIINTENLASTKSLLPPDTEFIEIEGGNHSQFGDYGLQKGDNPADISKEEQHGLVIENIIELLLVIEQAK